MANALNKVNSGGIEDGSIVNADVNASAAIAKSKLAGLDIVNADINASAAISGSKLADNAVGLAQMAHGTDGQIITYDASGAPLAVGPGTDGQVLTSTGAGSAPAFEDIPASGTPTNLLNNGAMQVAQRQTSLTMAHDGTTSGFGVDRWALQMHNADEFDGTLAQIGDDPAGDFTKCLRWTTGTAESAIAADEYVMVRQHIESMNLQHLRWGTASAKQLTLQFWVKSSITGTYGCSFYSGRSSGTRVINKTYAISSANTWEQKTITIAADTGGSVLANDNEAGLSIIFPLAAGSNYDGTTSTSWADYSTANYLGGHAQDGVVTTAGATWMITGVQLETGNSAGTFNHKSYAEELRDCKRYCGLYKSDVSGKSCWWFMVSEAAHNYGAYVNLDWDEPMRAQPTVSGGDEIKLERPQVGYSQRINAFDAITQRTLGYIKWPSSGTYGGSTGFSANGGDAYVRMSLSGSDTGAWILAEAEI
tara:strand:+ start:573 stop:2006 length:1434 start_codon:yes stop_codon:yes gene_type:complete